MNIIEQYKFNKTRIKIIKNDFEIYENNYLNLDEKENIKIINKLTIELDNLTEFNQKFDTVYNSLNETEKFFIQERYFKNKSYQDIVYFFLENQNLIPAISPYRKHINKPKSYNSIEHYLFKFNTKIFSKLERGVL
ncbi:hypothetical protein [Clostridium paraputrificum]|uniref:hypothetical protein n=1 Tax=Clostridium paraputrificum TaxID=29363 RepID=UPI0018970814|nr:hypothetical protein [Clostridium paraputrificum]MDB2123849.1 hypothetical protein [Clostridium paraputrificum]